MTPKGDAAARKTYSLPADLAREVADLARADDRPESAVVREALERYFADRPKSALPRFVGMAASVTTDPRPAREQIADLIGADHDAVVEDYRRRTGSGE